METHGDHGIVTPALTTIVLRLEPASRLRDNQLSGSFKGLQAAKPETPTVASHP